MGRWGRGVGVLKGRGAIGLGIVAIEDDSEGRRSDGERVWNRGGSSMMGCLMRSRGWSIDIRRCGARRTESSLSIEVLRIVSVGILEFRLRGSVTLLILLPASLIRDGVVPRIIAVQPQSLVMVLYSPNPVLRVASYSVSVVRLEEYRIQVLKHWGDYT